MERISIFANFIESKHFYKKKIFWRMRITILVKNLIIYYFMRETKSLSSLF